MLKKVKITSMDLIVQLMKPVIDEGKSVKFTVVGNSMYPVFRDGIENVIMTKPDRIKRRDVILYRRESGDYVLHRIIGRGKDGYKLCGDNQTAVEYPVKSDNIIAVMTGFERNGRTVNNDCLWYRLYSVLWCIFIPLRPAMLKTAITLKKIVKFR